MKSKVIHFNPLSFLARHGLGRKKKFFEDRMSCFPDNRNVPSYLNRFEMSFYMEMFADFVWMVCLSNDKIVCIYMLLIIMYYYIMNKSCSHLDKSIFLSSFFIWGFQKERSSFWWSGKRRLALKQIIKLEKRKIV